MGLMGVGGEFGEESVGEIEKIVVWAMGVRYECGKIEKIDGVGVEEFGKLANLHIRKSAYEKAR